LLVVGRTQRSTVDDELTFAVTHQRSDGVVRERERSAMDCSSQELRGSIREGSPARAVLSHHRDRARSLLPSQLLGHRGRWHQPNE
jgi:hypothetical protein